MEIEQLRKEINELLENVVEHSNAYSGNKPISSLEISFVLSKINKMQEAFIILKHLLNKQEVDIKRQKKLAEQDKLTEPKIEQIKTFVAEEKPEVQELIVEKIEEQLITEPVEMIVEPEKPKAKKDIEKLPIAKLVDAFSLNDRYLYANELFKKDMSAFNELVKSIDNCTCYQEAEQLLTATKNEFDWDMDYVHVLSFYSLVERRFF